jgi:hypothetical protein
MKLTSSTIDKRENGNKKATISYSSMLNEYYVRFWEKDIENADAQYFTDDKDDAFSTAEIMVGLTVDMGIMESPCHEFAKTQDFFRM